MRWEPATIAHFATRAGFVRPDVYTAVACAIAASGGLDHFDHRNGPPGCGRYVGLWGIDTDVHTQYDPDELGAPETAARAAYELTTAHGGFGWSPVWRAGYDRRHVDEAVAALGGYPFQEREHLPVASAAYRHGLDNRTHQRITRYG